MFSGKKIAVASGLACALAMSVAGAAQAYEPASGGNCSRDAQGNVTCVQRTQNDYTNEDGTHVVKQSTNCSSDVRKRVDRPEIGPVPQQNSGPKRQTTHNDPVVDCSNTAPKL